MVSLRNGNEALMHNVSWRDGIAGIIAIICMLTLAYQSIVGTDVSVPVATTGALAIGYFFRGAENGGLVSGKHSDYGVPKEEQLTE